MAYNNYYPQYYPQQYPQQFVQPTVQQPTQQNNGIIWCQGEAAAKSYPVEAGKSMLLMDSENSTFYIKSTDQSGMPLPLRVFDYTERQNDATTNSSIVTQKNVDYVSRSEFDAFKNEIQASLRSRQNNNSNMKRTTREE